ncbi:MAG: hypothetical protein JO138_24965 [Acidobacteriaceae bacterium]|nr:hypothetical protein [Acidobacteriaceae bacterium]
MTKCMALACLFTTVAVVLFGQESQPAPSATTPAPPEAGFKQREAQPGSGSYQVLAGTHILLSMINSVSTKQAVVGDRIYLETAFPVISNGRIVIPQGSWVTGTITEVKRPGHVKGRGELQVRFDSLTLPNGVSRDFRSDLGAVDPRDNDTLDREHNTVKGPGNRTGDAVTVAETTSTGTVIGSGIGAAAGNVARGAGIGVGAGAATGLLGVLLTRGPDATLNKGSTVEMVLDRPITFAPSDLDFSNAPPRAALSEGSNTQQQTQQRRLTPRVPY